MVFGHALRRVIHYIADARHKHPRAPILLQKVDFKAACRRAHLAPSTAVKTITTLDGIALMSLRLTFGGRPCPSEWCNVSESAADLARALLQCSDWDPSELHGPQQKHLGRPKVEGDDEPFAPALDMFVTLPDNKDGIVEPHIDDLIAAAPDLGDNKDRMSAATLLAIHALGRPASDSEPLPRDDLASIKKLLAEGMPSEVLCLLGWDADARRLLLRLPWSKCLAWRDDMLRLLRARGATRSELDTLVGRLNHVGHIIPAARHFLSRLRDRLWKARRHGRQRFDSEDAEDLNLWLRFLRRAADGMSMNLLTHRCPTHESTQVTPASTASADGPHPAERGDLPSPRSHGAGSPSIAWNSSPPSSAHGSTTSRATCQPSPACCRGPTAPRPRDGSGSRTSCLTARRMPT